MSRPRARRTAVAVKDYIDGVGGFCPCCGSKDIEPGRVQAARGRATGDFECFACHARWRDVYTLSTIEILTGQDRHKQTVESADGVAVAAPTLDALLETADAVAELRDLVRTAWRVMTPAQRTALSRECVFNDLTALPRRGSGVGSVSRRP